MAKRSGEERKHKQVTLVGEDCQLHGKTQQLTRPALSNRPDFRPSFCSAAFALLVMLIFAAYKAVKSCRHGIRPHSSIF